MPRRLRPVIVVLALLSTLLATGAVHPSRGADVRFVANYATSSDVPSDAFASRLGLDVLYRFSAIPAVALSGPRSAADRLQASTAVVDIEWDRELEYFLDTATPTINATDVWGEAWWPVAGDLTREPLRIGDEIIDGSGIGVGVVDSGVNALHPDLWDAKLHNPAMPWEAKTLACVHVIGGLVIDQPYCDETVGHGTHVAGIVAGTAAAVRNGLSNPGLGDRPYMGAAPGADIVGAGLGAALFIVDALAALDWMYENAERYNVRVVNNSWGDTPECSATLPSPSNATTAMVNAMVDKGIVVVFAAGNYGLDGPTWTGSQSRNPKPGVISVANYSDRNNINRDGQISGGSSDGCAGETDPLVWTWPDVSAPGTDIMSTYAYTGATVAALGALGPRRVPFYIQVSGTSMAAPAVAGVAALMLQANPDLTPAQVEQIIIETATPWQDSIGSRGIPGTAAHWGDNSFWRDWVDRDSCRVKPAHAGDPEAAAEEFPLFDQLPDPERFVCRDYRRGNGLVDAYAAVERAIELGEES